jgi:hypothetical protein
MFHLLQSAKQGYCITPKVPTKRHDADLKQFVGGPMDGVTDQGKAAQGLCVRDSDETVCRAETMTVGPQMAQLKCSHPPCFS